ncbi:MAG: hypothetical protein M3P27_02035 [Acidobacteriota bacterium]|nr:hypothetical protein [Acidobacteriota bacterium]
MSKQAQVDVPAAVYKRQMRKFLIAVLLFPLFPLLPLTAMAQAAPAPRQPDLRDLMQHVIQRAQWEKENKLDTRYRWRQNRVVEKYDQDGNIQDRTELLFEVIPAADKTTYHMLAKNGRPLSGGEQKAEEDKEAKSTASLKNTKQSAKDQSVAIDADLLSRFTFAYAGEEAVAGRKAYVLSFTPKPGPLPETRRMDRVLNHLRGQVWVDQQTYAVSKVDMALTEPVKYFAGLGVVRSMHLKIEMTALDKNVMVPQQTWVEYDARALFTNTKVHQHSVYSSYQPLTTTAAQR